MIVALFGLCEYLIYYLVQKNCTYADLKEENVDSDIPLYEEKPVRVMVLADTHLLGSRHGHWFDKLRREWQMYRAFQTAMTLHSPDLVFVLGDITDEGLFCSKDKFEYYVKRFYSLFSVPSGTNMHVIVGNHDIGFHYGISPYLNERFVSAFNSPPVSMFSLRGNHFVLLNSMALEGDGCFLCRPAEQQITKIEQILKCSKGINYGKCDKIAKLNKFSRPILLQHFPLYRQSDMDCNEPDSAHMPVKKERFRERWECLSQESTFQLLNQLHPRLALSGHTHHGCVLPLANGEGLEITVPSFSWRNKNDPTYSLFLFTPNNYSWSRCHMPEESTVIRIYMIGAFLILAWCIYNAFVRTRRHKYKLH